jgi:hypothetical protein
MYLKVNEFDFINFDLLERYKEVQEGLNYKNPQNNSNFVLSKKAHEFTKGITTNHYKLPIA